MPVKKSVAKVNAASRWLSRKQESFAHEAEAKKDTEQLERVEISARIKSAEIKPGKIYKAKLADDMRMFEYKVTKIDRQSGQVYLQNERKTIRKIHVNDKLFGPPPKFPIKSRR